MNSAPLESHGQCHHFFAPHLSIISNSMELIQGRWSFHPSTLRQGGSGPPAIFFPPCGWYPKGCSLPAGQPFDFDITKVLILRAKKRSGLPPPFWHSFILLQVGVDPLTYLNWASPNIFLGFLCFLGKGGGWVGAQGMEY